MKDNIYIPSKLGNQVRWWQFWKRKHEVITPQKQEIRVMSTVKPDDTYTYNDVFVAISAQLKSKSKIS